MSISFFHANEIIEGSNTGEDTEGGRSDRYLVNRGGGAAKLGCDLSCSRDSLSEGIS
jgi:hypothetical protein